MNPNLKEAASHGSDTYPFALYRLFHLQQQYHMALHWHDEIEIIYIEEGTLHLVIGNEVYEGTKGDVYFVNSKEIHSMATKDLSTQYDTILFSLDLLISRRDDVVSQECLLPLSHGKQQLVCHPTDSVLTGQITSALKEIILQNTTKAPFYQFRTKVLLFELLYLMFYSGQVTDSLKNPKDLALHRKILTYINEHYTQTISLEQIAKQFHMVPKYFSRYFKTAFHITLTSYINHLRLEHARNLLMTTEASITEIAINSGYNNISHFNHQFKEIYGVTPRSFRS